MEEINNLMKEMSVNTFDVGASYWVDITHINNPHSFYVRPRAYNMYMPVVQERGERINRSEITLGTIVVYKSKILKKYVRAKVLSIADDIKPRFDLYAIDIGLIERSVSLKRLWKPYYVLNVPSLVTHCHLADCAPKGSEWDEVAINAMKTYVEGERAKAIVRSRKNDSVSVEIYNTCPDDIATLLALTGFTTLGYV